jgi:methionyl-tRNA formyltransferase
MLMDEHLDTGPVLLRTELPLPDTITAGELEPKLAEIGASLLIKTLDGLRSGTIHPVPQDGTQATFAPRIKKETARIAWEKSARDIHNMVRAFNPWPLAFSDSRNQRIQILRSFPESAGAEQSAPGRFLGFTRDGIRVQCGAGTVLELLQVQPASKRPVTGREFGIGARLKPNETVFGTSGPGS